MSKDEFIEELKKIGSLEGEKIDDKQYKLVEFVYTFHPSISDTAGKAQVAWLYKNFGIRIFADMLPTAEKAKELDTRKQRVVREIQEIDSELEKLIWPTL